MENTLLNLIPAAYLPEIHLSQYDVGRTITFTLKDGASDYSVPSGASVKVKATKPSGFGFEVACTFNGGTVTLVTTDTMTPENGRFPAELSIVSGNTTIGTSNFIFNIERSPHPEGTIDGDAETIIPELTLLVERIEAAAEDVDEKAELFLNLSAEAETLPAGSLATANYSDGVLTLGIPRGYDGDDTKADAIVKSASGEVASFSDGGNGLLVKSLNVNITPKQSGSGDPSPSNVRTISGYSDVNVTRCGKNLLDPAYRYNIHASSNYHIRYYWDSTSATYNENLLVKAGVTYTFSYVGTNASGIYIKKSATENVAVKYNTNTVTFTPTEDFWLAVDVYWTTEPSGGVASINPILSVGSTATTYEPYQGTSYPISLGQTVYGGTLEVMSGKLTDKMRRVDLGSLNWDYLPVSSSIPYGAFYSALYYKKNGEDNFVTDCYKISNNGFRVDKSAIGNSGANNIYIMDSSFNGDTTAFKTSLNGRYMVFERTDPTEIQLTPTQVTTLLGNNNIFADSGDVEVEYRADTTLAYNELLSLIASL